MTVNERLAKLEQRLDAVEYELGLQAEPVGAVPEPDWADYDEDELVTKAHVRTPEQLAEQVRRYLEESTRTHTVPTVFCGRPYSHSAHDYLGLGQSRRHCPGLPR